MSTLRDHKQTTRDGRTVQEEITVAILTHFAYKHSPVFCLQTICLVDMERKAWTAFAIHSLGYHGRACISKCLCDELPCPLITWLVSELKSTCPEGDTEGKRHTGNILAGDLRAFLKEMSCPYSTLMSETLTPASLNHIAEFLVSELQAAHMITYKESHPEDSEASCESAKDCREKTLDEAEMLGEMEAFVSQDDRQDGDTEEAKTELSQLLEALSLDVSSNLTDVQQQVTSCLAKLPGGEVPKPLLNNELNADQWKRLGELNDALTKDYRCRRHMMIKRFEVTLQSFTWGERGKEREKVVSSMALSLPLGEPRVSASLLLAAREDQSQILPVMAGPSTAVHKVLMGSVPDRGGRPGEIEPPMPDWKRERAHGGDSSHRRNKYPKHPKKKNRK
ncbi:protein FAM98B [Engraulis encrasicolus]|uniref:protein FAM98B n=1 Tax=Engraulis encrasicolus TaxID=184585 RepID=UPI002FD6DFAE